ncbi:MAG: hypothetical protein ACRDOB_27840, partial [Streptosporangiaceae bacterium]
MLAAKLTRRILALAGAAAVPVATLLALAGPLLAGPASASTAHRDLSGQAGTVSVAIDSMSPQTARAGDTVTMTGTVTNRTAQTEAGLVVSLLSSA